MAQIKLLVASVFLTLSLFHCIHSSEGINLNVLRKNELPKLTFRNIIFTKKAKEIAEQNSNLHVESKNKPSYVKESVPVAPMQPTPPSQSADGTRPPPPAHVDDFRPTAPGHSPGVGHSIQN
ncbi:hypothetical protein Acr_05g0001430 [Actinidia rufa]|uniref:Uncharacterized protein n=1 Tax=Actinidia rufa TaxID=165716 RepID=A0A7J0EJ63_9ERIC|nr:hypothetical protein Acr_05g0001430 [Actinidia rufa]